MPLLGVFRDFAQNLFAGPPRSDWMETYSGGIYYPAAPRACDVRIVDIAHHLSMLCRFTGAVKWFYSVAEHSVLVSRIVPPELGLIGLLHDASEAYTSDISRPLKRSLPDYRRIEYLNWLAIAEKFGLPEIMPDCIKVADNAICQRERLELLLPFREPDWQYLGDAADVEIHCWSPEQAEKEFLNRFYDLTRGLGAVRKVDPLCPIAGLQACPI